MSTIRANLDEQYAPADLLRACFPGGSITGAPKVRAMQIIEELEPHRRSAYCGSIGYISRHGRMDTSITIRTLVAEKTNFTLGLAAASWQIAIAPLSIKKRWISFQRFCQRCNRRFQQHTTPL